MGGGGAGARTSSLWLSDALRERVTMGDERVDARGAARGPVGGASTSTSWTAAGGVAARSAGAGGGGAAGVSVMTTSSSTVLELGDDGVLEGEIGADGESGGDETIGSGGSG